MTDHQGSAIDERCQYCTFPLTQNKSVFQSIFVCHSCTPEDGQLLCLCQACADHCHADHDGLEYVGMGPCYCDCRQILVGCRIVNESDREAKRLLNGRPCLSQKPSTNRPLTSVKDSRLFSLIEGKEVADRLQLQTQTLVKHSKETFWVDPSIDPIELSELELLAWTILNGHCQRYSLKGCGAEWWVQVKNVSSQRSNGDRMVDNTSEAVDLHYDKDETIAEKFGIGVFPLISTVTYLTDSGNAPPTVVFSKRYDQPEDETISEMLLSYPRQGNHLVFDGRLLHGAPANYLLRRPGVGDNRSYSDIRVTFLVNIWDMECKPVGVEPLPQSIRQHLFSDAVKEPFPLSSENFARQSGLFAESIQLNDELSIPEALRQRIELPFLGATTTWESASDDGSTTFVVTFPSPIAAQSDLLLVSFGPGMEAYVENDSSGDEEEQSLVV